RYLFADLQIGEYEVREIVPSGWEVATGFSDNYTAEVFSGVETTVHDFANFDVVTEVAGSIAGVVWNDANENGIKEGGEAALAGRTVFLDLNSNGVKEAGEAEIVTTASGEYSFTNVSTGTVSVVLVST